MSAEYPRSAILPAAEVRLAEAKRLGQDPDREEGRGGR